MEAFWIAIIFGAIIWIAVASDHEEIRKDKDRCHYRDDD